MRCCAKVDAAKELRNVHISAVVGMVILVGGALLVRKSEAALQLVYLGRSRRDVWSLSFPGKSPGSPGRPALGRRDRREFLDGRAFVGLGHREEAEEALGCLLSSFDLSRTRIERFLEWELVGEDGG